MGHYERSLPLLLALFLGLLTTGAVAAQPLAWPDGKRAAIVLTYDDALASQLDVAVPQLKAAGLTGTFFLKGDNMTPQIMLRWRAAQADGNELGNHTIFHPCPRAMLPNESHATEDYTPQTLVAEITVMNDLLFGIDGQTGTRTLAYPCSQTLTGGGDYVAALRQSGQIAYARTGGDPYNSVISDFAALDPLNIPSNGPTNHPDGAELIAYVERVHAAGGLGVLQFHGVGGDYLEVSAEAHQQLVDYLKAHPDIWVAPFHDVLDYVEAHTPAN